MENCHELPIIMATSYKIPTNGGKYGSSYSNVYLAKREEKIKMKWNLLVTSKENLVCNKAFERDYHGKLSNAFQDLLIKSL